MVSHTFTYNNTVSLSIFICISSKPLDFELHLIPRDISSIFFSVITLATLTRQIERNFVLLQKMLLTNHKRTSILFKRTTLESILSPLITRKILLKYIRNCKVSCLTIERLNPYNLTSYVH